MVRRHPAIRGVQASEADHSGRRSSNQDSKLETNGESPLAQNHAAPAADRSRNRPRPSRTRRCRRSHPGVEPQRSRRSVPRPDASHHLCQPRPRSLPGAAPVTAQISPARTDVSPDLFVQFEAMLTSPEWLEGRLTTDRVLSICRLARDCGFQFDEAATRSAMKMIGIDPGPVWDRPLHSSPAARPIRPVAQIRFESVLNGSAGRSPTDLSDTSMGEHPWRPGVHELG